MRNFLIQTIIISCFLFVNSISAQNNLLLIGKRILAADSVIIYASPKNDTLDLSTLNDMDSILHQNLFTVRKKLRSNTKSELSQIFMVPSKFKGRFASRSGFSPTEFIVIWKNKSAPLIKVSTRTHDLWYSNAKTNYIFIDPRIVDRLDQFYYKIGVNR